MLGNYLVQAKEKSKVDGAGIYACPYDVKSGADFFYNNAFGFYSWVIGVNLAKTLNDGAVPSLVKYCEDKDFAAKIEHSFATNWRGLKKIDEDLYCPMFGFKTCDEYYEASVMSGRFQNIKTPTMCLSADDD